MVAIAGTQHWVVLLSAVLETAVPQPVLVVRRDEKGGLLST